MSKVITVGEILVEMMAKEVDQGFIKAGQWSGPYPSGAPAIFIDQVARMDVECGIIACVGNDHFGELNLKKLKEDGVDTSGVSISEDYTTGTAFVVYYSDGGREFIYHFPNSAAGQLEPQNIKKNYISKAEYLHIMGCSLAGSQNMRSAIRKAVLLAKEEDISLSFDPNLRPELLKRQEYNLLLNEILFHTDIVLTGRKELTSLFKKGVEICLKILREKGVKLVVLRSGADKIEVYKDKKLMEYKPPKVEEIDPTGAGDCFDGAFIASLTKGYKIEKAIRYGAVAGALSVRKFGPMEGTSFESEIESFLQ